MTYNISIVKEALKKISKMRPANSLKPKVPIEIIRMIGLNCDGKDDIAFSYKLSIIPKFGSGSKYLYHEEQNSQLQMLKLDPSHD